MHRDTTEKRWLPSATWPRSFDFFFAKDLTNIPGPPCRGTFHGSRLYSLLYVLNTALLVVVYSLPQTPESLTLSYGVAKAVGSLSLPVFSPVYSDLILHKAVLHVYFTSQLPATATSLARLGSRQSREKVVGFANVERGNNDARRSCLGGRRNGNGRLSCGRGGFVRPGRLSR